MITIVATLHVDFPKVVGHISANIDNDCYVQPIDVDQAVHYDHLDPLDSAAAAMVVPVHDMFVFITDGAKPNLHGWSCRYGAEGFDGVGPLVLEFDFDSPTD